MLVAGDGRVVATVCVWLRAEIASTADSRRKDDPTTTVHPLQALVAVRARADSTRLVHTARGGVFGVWRSEGPTGDACLLACLLARSLACFVCVDLGGCREWWSSVQQVPAASDVTRGSARLRRGE